MKGLLLFLPKEAPFCLSWTGYFTLLPPKECISSRELSPSHYLPQIKPFPYLCWTDIPLLERAGNTTDIRESEAVKPCMSAWLEKKTLAWPGWYYFDFMWYFSLKWLEHLNQENSPLFPYPEWGAIQQCWFSIVTCQFNNLRGEGRQIKLGWYRAR